MKEHEATTTAGRVIDTAEYYRLSQNMESIRAICRQLQELIPRDGQDVSMLAECVETHGCDDTLALLAVVDEMDQDDVLSPEVWDLIGRHYSIARLQGVLAELGLVPHKATPLRERLESLITKKLKRLTRAQRAAIP